MPGRIPTQPDPSTFSASCDFVFSSLQHCFSAPCDFVFSSMQLCFQLQATLFFQLHATFFSFMRLCVFSSMRFCFQLHATFFSAPCNFVFVFSSIRLCFQRHANLFSGEPGWDAARDKSLLAAAEKLCRARAHGVQRGGHARLSRPLCLLCH